MLQILTRNPPINASIHLFWGLYGLFICLIKAFAMLSCFLIISSRGFGVAIWPLYQGYGDAIWLLSSLFIKLQYFIHYAFMYMGPRMAFDSVLSLGFISSAVFSTDIFLGTYQINTLLFELVVWSFLLWLILQYCWFLLLRGLSCSQSISSFLLLNSADILIDWSCLVSRKF